MECHGQYAPFSGKYASEVLDVLVGNGVVLLVVGGIAQTLVHVRALDARVEEAIEAGVGVGRGLLDPPAERTDRFVVCLK